MGRNKWSHARLVAFLPTLVPVNPYVHKVRCVAHNPVIAPKTGELVNPGVYCGSEYVPPKRFGDLFAIEKTKGENIGFKMTYECPLNCVNADSPEELQTWKVVIWAGNKKCVGK